MEGKLKAVIVEDDEMMRGWLKACLETFGYSVETYESPVACPIFTEDVEKCCSENSCYDLLITDYKMDHVDGLEFLRRQKSKNCRIRKMALMSGALEGDVLSEARKAKGRYAKEDP